MLVMIHPATGTEVSVPEANRQTMESRGFVLAVSDETESDVQPPADAEISTETDE
jgi:hypothetical protein